jgi:arylformamidase
MLNPDIFHTDMPSIAPLLSQLPEREKEYSPSSAIGGNYQPFIKAYVDRSLEAYALVKCIKDLRYGDAERALIDYFPAPKTTNGKPGLLVFIHGGYWQELSKNESSFLAPAWHAAGFAHAVVGYTLAPQASLFEIVSQCRAAVAYLRDQADELGHDLRGFVPISGVFDLRPLVGTSINDAVGLTMQDATQLSRITAGAARVPGVVAWGEIETLSFKQQSQSLAAHLRAQGQRCTELELPGRNHFDVVHELGDAQSPLFKAAMNLFDAQ